MDGFRSCCENDGALGSGQSLVLSRVWHCARVDSTFGLVRIELQAKRLQVASDHCVRIGEMFVVCQYIGVIHECNDCGSNIPM